MIFTRSDDIDSLGNQRVTYSLSDCPGYTFTFSTTKTGITISGTTPVFTDFTQLNLMSMYIKVQHDSLRTQGVSVPDNIIFSYKLFPTGP